MQRTQTQQRQIAASKDESDNLPLGYSDRETLEADLNYLRSVIRDLKGTVTYDSQLVKNLDELANAMSNPSFDSVVLTGVSTSSTPPLADVSDRIATTSFVDEKMQNLVGSPDVKYIHDQGVPSSEWNVLHRLGKYPAVSVVDSGGTAVEGSVRYIDTDSLTITFSVGFSGKAFLN